MNETNTVRHQSVTSGLEMMVARCIERRIAVAESAMSGSPIIDRHTGALRLLAGRFRGMDVNDPRLVALDRARNALGRPINEGTFDVEPGSEQNAVLCRAGVDVDPPDTDRLVAEFVAAALDDVIKAARTQIAHANQARQRADTEAQRLAPFEQRALAAEASVIDLEHDLRVAREERARAEREATYLRSQQLPEDERPKTGQTSIEGEPYIYATASGKFKAQPPERPAKTFATLEEAREYRDDVAVAA